MREKNEIGDKRIVQEINNIHKNCEKKKLAVQIRKKRIGDRDYFVQKSKNYFPGNNFGRTSDIFW